MTLATRNLEWHAGDKMVVDGISLSARTGKVLGLIGPNGSGKSTLLRLLCRLRKPAAGVVTLGDIDLSKMHRTAIARRIALVEQQATTETQITVLDVVRLGRTPHRGPLSSWTTKDDQAVEAGLRHVGMSERRLQLWHTLSGGEQQRVHIARALAQTPSELLLDEPTNHLDIHHQIEILSLVKKMAVTTIMALHDLNLAAMFCDTIAVLSEGRIVASGSSDEVLNASLIQRVFGVRAHVERSPHHHRPHIHYLMD